MNNNESENPFVNELQELLNELDFDLIAIQPGNMEVAVKTEADRPIGADDSGSRDRSSRQGFKHFYLKPLTRLEDRHGPVALRQLGEVKVFGRDGVRFQVVPDGIKLDNVHLFIGVGHWRRRIG